MKILSGHISPETAYVVDDYPYGFRLRCKIRYWLESSPNKGVRFVSQTTNPKRGDVWNKPKASTYSRFGGSMFLDENNHVQWSGITEYSDLEDMLKWKQMFYSGIPADFRPIFDNWLNKKNQLNILKAAGAVSLNTTVMGQTERTILQPEIIPAELQHLVK